MRCCTRAARFRANERVQERAMDSNELERERGITILAKNTAVHYQDILINIVDTPGHADFGGEVERTLSMVDGVLLLVDASEGPAAADAVRAGQGLRTRLPPIVVINKIDRPDARASEVLNEVFDLFIDLDASEKQLDFPVLYTNAKKGTAGVEPNEIGDDLRPLFDAIVKHVPPPMGSADDPLQILVANLDSSDYLGRIAIGRIFNGAGEAGRRCGDLFAGAPGGAQGENHEDVHVRRPQADSRSSRPPRATSSAWREWPTFTIAETITEIERQAPVPVIAVDEPTVSISSA
jgi:GTP-binding protein